jgi:hypothetical protein
MMLRLADIVISTSNNSQSRLRFGKAHEEYLSVFAFINRRVGGKRRDR